MCPERVGYPPINASLTPPASAGRQEELFGPGSHPGEIPKAIGVPWSGLSWPTPEPAGKAPPPSKGHKRTQEEAIEENMAVDQPSDWSNYQPGVATTVAYTPGFGSSLQPRVKPKSGVPRTTHFPVFSLTYEEPLPGEGKSNPWTADKREGQVIAETCFHSQVRLVHGEGLVVDTGAVENLTGNDFVRRHVPDATKHGYKTKWLKLDRPKYLSGVGDATKAAYEAVDVAIALETGEVVRYRAPVIPGDPSPIPPLLGLSSMQAELTMFDVVNGTMYHLPNLQALKDLAKHMPAGTRTRQCVAAPSKHWILPVSAWSARPMVGQPKL